MKILGNPILLRAAVVFFFSAFAFLLGLVFIRKLRTSIAEEADVSTGPAPSLDTLPMHVYNTVIQELKQQKHELQVQSQAEQNRARTSETLSQAVLSNLACGVLVFGTNGLVKTTNPAAKEILGFGATAGMGADDIFRGAVVRSAKAPVAGALLDETTDESVTVADEVDAVLRGCSNRPQVQAEYETPAGEERHIAVSVSPVSAEDGSLLGVTCLIDDLSELERIRRQQELQGEASTEMALQLRTSLATISGYAQQLANSRDPEMAKQLATDIAHETAQLDHKIGGFLTEKQALRSTAAAASGD